MRQFSSSPVPVQDPVEVPRPDFIALDNFRSLKMALLGAATSTKVNDQRNILCFTLISKIIYILFLKCP